jgi:hypothetical protein
VSIQLRTSAAELLAQELRLDAEPLSRLHVLELHRFLVVDVHLARIEQVKHDHFVPS